MSVPKSSHRGIPWAVGVLIACVVMLGLVAIAGWWAPVDLPTDVHLEDQIRALQMTLAETDIQLSKLSGRERDDAQRIDAGLADLEKHLKSISTAPSNSDSRQIAAILLQLKAVDTDLTTLFNRTSKPARLR